MVDDYSDDRLMAEHASRGHHVWVAEPKDLVLSEGKLFVHVTRYNRQADTVIFAEPSKQPVTAYDFIYYRAMPPVEKDMLHATFLLENINVPFCNHPSAIRNLNEKLHTLRFADDMPPTLITSSPNDIELFAKDHGWPLVIKPLDGFQSKGVAKIESINTLPSLDQLMMVQPYLPSVEIGGSKRVFILSGDFIGAVSFLPDPGDFRTNFGRVPSIAATSLSEREAAICKRVGAHLVNERVKLAALDFIDDYLMEINITCPGGIPQWNEQYGGKLEAVIVDGLVG